LGGGAPIRPGEITLAHRGVLFLDETAEFRRDALEGLRQPLEEGDITVGRAQARHRFPARFVFLAATNPCPCGFRGDPLKECRCPPGALARYEARLSGPLLDRIDMVVPVRAIPFAELVSESPGESASAVRARVASARRRQEGRDGVLNAELDSRAIGPPSALGPEGRRLMEAAHDRLGLSARGHVRVLRVARTIGDLAGERRVAAPHLAEALQYRTSDRASRTLEAAAGPAPR
jgi:magnesium chelatase family protein